MITMTLEAEDLPQMRDELLKAAHAIKTNEAVQDEDTNDMYEPMDFQPPVAAIPNDTQDDQEQEDGVSFSEPGTASQVQQNSGGDVDANGFPWDSRIHAESKTKTKVGLWKYRRNLEDAVKAQVEAQLRGQQSLPPMGTPPRTFETPNANNVVAFTPPPVPGAAAPVFPVTPQAAPVQAAPVVEPSPTPAAPTSVVPAHSLATFKQNLFPVIAQLTKDGKITQAYVQQIKTHFNVAELWDLTDAQVGELFTVLSTTNPPIIVAVQA